MTLIDFRQSVVYLPICPICNQPVALETAKTDEHGQAIHEECYVVAVKLRLEISA